MYSLGNKGIRITRFFLHETGTYDTQMSRPYETSINGMLVNQFAERLQGARQFSPALMAGVANNFIQPMATPEKEIEIVGGWGARRMRFMMEVESENELIGKTTEIVLGYTDHVGLSHSGIFDPNMIFYVNSVLQSQVTTRHTPLGMAYSSRMIDNSHILASERWDGMTDQSKQYRMRPEDVYKNIELSKVNTGSVTATDSRVIHTSQAVKSHRTNGVASQYVSSLLNSYRNATLAAGANDSGQDILYDACGEVTAQLVGNDTFLQAISQIQRGLPSNRFAYRDLLTLDPNADRVKEVRYLSQTSATKQMHTAGEAMHWKGSDRETVVATILSQAVPALMMEVGLTKMDFGVTNGFGQAVFTPSAVFCFGALNKAQQARIFEQRFLAETIRDISFDNQVQYTIKMRVDLVGETEMTINLNNGGVYTYVTPSFCDALLVPVLTSNYQALNNLASNFSNLMEDLVDVDVPQQHSHFDGYQSLSPAPGKTTGGSGLFR